MHFNLTFLLEVDEKETLRIKEDENSGVKWIPIEEINKYCSEQWMKDKIYPKLIEKLNIR